MRPRHHAFVVVAVSCALLASSAGPILSQLPKDPCAEVTQAQVAAALGMNVGPGQVINSLNSSCAWSATGSSRVRLTVQFQVADTYSRIRNTQLPGVQKTPVAGVGDDAVSQTVGSSATAALTMLFVRKGKTMITVRVYGVSDSARQLAAEKTVAQAVVGKI